MKLRALTFRVAVGLVVVSAASAACDRELTVGSGPEVPSETPTDTSTEKNTNVWAGYVEAFAFASGSDRMTVTFTSPTTGTVVFGDNSVDPPPVDPSVTYPPGCNAAGGLGADNSSARCAEHFVFTMRDAIQEPDRLRFAVDIGDMWTTWCKGQTLITVNSWIGTGQPQTYGCAGVAPGNGGACEAVRVLPDGGPPLDVPTDGAMPVHPRADTAVDCDLATACISLCTCTSTGCERRRQQRLSFDLHVDGNKASGGSGIGTVYLKPQ